MQLTIWTENVRVCPRFGRFRWLRAYGVLRSAHCSVGFIDDWNDKHGPFFGIEMKCPYLLSLNFKVLNKRITYETLWKMHKWLMQAKGRNLNPWFVDSWFMGTTGLSEPWGNIVLKKNKYRNWNDLTRDLLGLWIFHRLLGGGAFERPPMISAPGRRREKRKAAFESSRKSISKSFRPFFCSCQNWGPQGSKFQNFPKRFFDDHIFNFNGRATNLTPSCLSR